jgi:protein gp37
LGDHSKIEWTDATWNPTTGCTRVSAGCDHCYAAVLANGRLADIYLRRTPAKNSALNRRDPFSVRLWPERLAYPLKWKDSRRIFVNSMSDLFHTDIPESFQRQVFDVMLRADHHIYQVLTKRPSRAERFVRRNADLFVAGIVPAHIWIGTSVESQKVVHRIDQLRDIPAEMRFLSCEPLLGPLELDLDGIEWVIVGGESGLGYRPMDLEWAREIRDQCLAADVAFFFKQVGGRTPKAGGRVLDGRTWDEYPSPERALATAPAY